MSLLSVQRLAQRALPILQASSARMMSGTAQQLVDGKLPEYQHVEKGTTYNFCACGLSKTSPFCDGHHKGTHCRGPIKFTAPKTGKARLCLLRRGGSTIERHRKPVRRETSRSPH